MGMFAGLKAIFSNGVPKSEVENLDEYKDLNEFHALESGLKTTLRTHYDYASQKEADCPTVSKGNGSKEPEAPKENSNSTQINNTKTKIVEQDKTQVRERD